MKKLLTIGLLAVASFCYAQKKPVPDTLKADTVSIIIPPRQLQKLTEIEKMRIDLDARKEDILLDLLAVPENEAKIKGAQFLGLFGNKIKFVKR